MKQVPNIQQEFDNYLFNSINDIYGNGAPGQDWILDKQNNTKNKYAVIREYRTIGSDELLEIVRGRINTNYGCVVITTTRLIPDNIGLKGEKYGAIVETTIYLAASNLRQNQLRGDSRITYEMTADVIFCLVNNKFEFNQYQIPVVPNFSESDFTTKEIDVLRAPISIQASRYI